MDNNINNLQNNPNLNNVIPPNNISQNPNIQNNIGITQTIEPNIEEQTNQQKLVVQPNLNPVATEQPDLQFQNQIPIVEPQPHVDIESHIKDQLQNIPTVEQNKQDFINNVQNMNQETNVQKKESINFIFIIILFVIILAAIYFLFPILLKYI